MKTSDKKRVFVDMDGVLCDFRKRFIELFKERPEVDYPSKKKEKEENTGSIECTI
jgi:hypothetical protein